MKFLTKLLVYFHQTQGMCLLTLVVSLPSLKPPSCGKHVTYLDCDKRATSFQVGIFYCALYIVAFGTGGTKPNISTMGADQFDDFEPNERAQKLTFFNWWMFSIFFGTLFSNTFIVYIQDNVGWGLGYFIATSALFVALIVFVIGTPIYRHKRMTESPFTNMARVLVAAARKRNVVVPVDPEELYELTSNEYSCSGKHRIDHSSSLRLFYSSSMTCFISADY